MPKITSSAELRNNYNELYNELKIGLYDIAAGRVVSVDDAKAMFRKKYPNTIE